MNTQPLTTKLNNGVEVLAKNTKYGVSAVTQIGIGADGSPLHAWTEENGTRSFVEVYTYFTATSGQVYGVVNVIELTP